MTRLSLFRNHRWFPAILPVVVAILIQSSAISSQASDLPDIGDSSFAALSQHDEEALGEAFIRSVRRSLPIMNDPVVEEYVQALGYRLAANSSNYFRAFDFFVVDSNQINAFAGPGGYIGINSGLILVAHSESEVAAVMAHEIAHVTQRHIARSVELQKDMSVPSMVALLGAMILATQSGEAGSAALAAVLAGSAQQQINFIRRNEKEADREGIKTLAKTNLDPQAMPGFFEKMQNSGRYSDYNAPDFLRTHPVTQSRIADSRNRAAQYPVKQYRSSLEFYLVKARIRFLSYKQPQDALKYFGSVLKQGHTSNRSAATYGYILALAATGRGAQARREMNALRAGHPENIIMILGAAEVEIKTGHPEQALPGLKHALDLYPGNLPLTLTYADALLQVKRVDDARGVLRDYLRNNPGHPKVYLLMARAERAGGNPVAFHEALAEHYFLDGDTRGAITQLQLVQGRSGLSYYEESRVTARLHELERQALAEAKVEL